MNNGLYEQPIFRIAGDRGMLVEYGNAIDPAISSKVRAVDMAMAREMPAGVLELIPTYRSLIIIYDPAVTAPPALKNAVLSLEEHLSEIEIPQPDTVEIPVCYGGDFGPDMAYVAQAHDLTVAEVIRIHSEPLYPVYMIGFTPGFPYLGGLSERLRTPRHSTPRTSVPAGSVGIANAQTGIYSITSPGGWQLIGRTPSKLFDPERPDPFLLKAGNLLKFKPISADEYDKAGHPVSLTQTETDLPGFVDMFKVSEPGAHTTVQDRGRHGYQQFGVPPTGALDQSAFRVANMLVGNPEEAAVLEITFSGPSLEILTDADVAVTGAEMPVSLNDRLMRAWTSFRVRQGDRLSLGQTKNGCRAYLAVTGGIDVPPVMGSRSCYVGAKLGGFHGRPLAKGDIILRGEGIPDTAPRYLPEQLIPRYASEILLRAIPGPQEDFFDEGLETFFTSAFTVSANANRMGYRLQGPAIRPRKGFPESIISEPSLPGGVQVPADGQPIVLLVEQTVGGYTKIATVISADIPLVAQAMPGDKVRFEQVDIGAAHAAFREQETRIRRMKEEIRTGRRVHPGKGSAIGESPEDWMQNPEKFMEKIYQHLLQT